MWSNVFKRFKIAIFPEHQTHLGNRLYPTYLYQAVQGITSIDQWNHVGTIDID